MPKSITLSMTCSTAVIMMGPPGAPSTRNGLPSLTTMVGIMDDSGRLPGAMALRSPCTRPNMLGVPGFEAKSSISSLRRKPAPGTVMALP